MVNNNAATVMVTLDTLAKGGGYCVPKGQLVEIGGSFRISDIIESSDAVLKEVGSTNKTHLKDYEQAINETTSCLLQVHPSRLSYNRVCGGSVHGRAGKTCSCSQSAFGL